MATVKIANVMSQNTAENVIAKLDGQFCNSYLMLTFGAAPAYGSFDIWATSDYPHLSELAKKDGQKS